MKKPIAIACVLLLLVVFIGVERFKGTQRGGPTAATHTGLDAPNSLNGRRVGTPTHSEAAANTPSSPKSISAIDVGEESEKVDLVSPQSQSSAGNGVLGQKISELHYIRGRTVLGASEPDKESIARLLEAVKQVAAGFDGSVIVFDLDGLTTSQSPFLSYASPRLDLTKAVQVAYRLLDENDAAADQGIGIEQGTVSDGDEPPH